VIDQGKYGPEQTGGEFGIAGFDRAAVLLDRAAQSPAVRAVPATANDALPMLFNGAFVRRHDAGPSLSPGSPMRAPLAKQDGGF